MKTNYNLIEGYYNIVLNLKTRRLTVANYLNNRTDYYLLSKQQTKALLLLTDNKIKSNYDIMEFVKCQHINSAYNAINKIRRKIKEINIKTLNNKGYVLINKILVDY